LAVEAIENLWQIEDACFSDGGQQAHDAGIFLLKLNIGKSLVSG
jgi:hypothetical protein